MKPVEVVLTSLILTLGAQVTPTSGRFDNNKTSVLLLNYVQQSEKFIPCFFHASCYCRYDQRTELYDLLKWLWLSSSFNHTTFVQSVTNLKDEMRNDPSETYYFDEKEVITLGGLVMSEYLEDSENLLWYNAFEPGPVYEILCDEAPIATLPTEYNTQGMMSQLSITGSNLVTLDASSFAGIEIQNIDLSQNHLYHIADHAFRSMSNSLAVLDLSSNFLDEIPFGALQSLKVLEWLNLGDNLIISLEGDWFFLPVSLKRLGLAGNSLSELPNMLLSEFSQLAWLDVSSNFIANVTLENVAPNLQTVILMDNLLSKFPIGVLHLSQLSWLILSENTIENIPSEWPYGVAPLQMNHMDLSENFLQTWPSKPFGAQLTLLDLDASENYLEAIPEDAFYSFSLVRLSFSHNRLKRIDSGALNTLNDSLQYINLDNNFLTDLPWEIITNFTEIKHLYIGNNLLTNEGIGEPFDCKLYYVGLNGNYLTDLPMTILTQCSELVMLNLGYNHIVNLELFGLLDIKKVIFKNLGTLSLESNPIKSLLYEPPDELLPVRKQDEMKKAPDGVDIIFRKNEDEADTTVPNVFVKSLFPNLYELSLSFCQLTGEMPAFPLPQLTNLEISMGLPTATKINAAMLQSLRNLEWLALDFNHIQIVEDFSFYSNRNLSYVNLEWNGIERLPRQMFHPDIHRFINVLRMSHNEIKSIEPESFLAFPGTVLDFSYNSINKIEKLALTSDAGKFSTTLANTIFETSDEYLPYGAKKTKVTYERVTKDFGNGTDSRGPAQNGGLYSYFLYNRIIRIEDGAFSLPKFALVDLSFNQLSSFRFEVFGKDTVVEGVNISNNAVTKVSLDDRPFQLVRFFDLSHNQVDYNGLNIGHICPTELLDLSHNNLDKVDASILPANCSLKELRIGSNQISNVKQDSFGDLKELTGLSLRQNKIKWLPPYMVETNTKLTMLDLSRNVLRSMPRNSLSGSSIEILDLSNNNFVSLPVGALNQISRKLKRLDMSFNALEHLDSTMFEALTTLISLNVSNNRLTILPDKVFNSLHSLRELDLSDNTIKANLKEMFSVLPKLRIVRMSNCGIKVLPHLPLPQLVSLDLSANGLRKIRKDSFEALKRLRELDLSNNQLVGSFNWNALHDLISLKMSNNPIESLTKDTFASLPRLESLEILDMPKVTRFDTDVLLHLSNLKRLAAETYPNIEKFKFRLGGVLSSLTNLEELYVKVNEKVLADELRGGIPPKLNKLTITGSNLKRINLKAFYGIQNVFRMDLTIKFTSIEEVPYDIFESLQNTEWARVDLSYNKIGKLDFSTVYSNKSLWNSRGTKLLEGGLVLNGNYWKCDCSIGWLGEWQRRWFRESFQSHEMDIADVHRMYKRLSVATCFDPNRNKVIPLIKLQSDSMCQISAISKASKLHKTFCSLNLIIIILYYLAYL